jgi:hypothetical protein
LESPLRLRCDNTLDRFDQGIRLSEIIVPHGHCCRANRHNALSDDLAVSEPDPPFISSQLLSLLKMVSWEYRDTRPSLS